MLLLLLEMEQALNLKVTTSDSTRLAVTDFSVTTQKIRLEPFIFSSDEKYVCAFSSGKIEIFRVNTDGSFNSLATTLTTDSASAALPFTDANLQEFTYAQAGDFMFIAHNDFMPRELVRTGLNKRLRSEHLLLIHQLMVIKIYSHIIIFKQVALQ